MPLLMQDWMTVAPQTIGADVTLAAARCMMRDYGVGHLPVRRDGHLVGVIARNDLDALPPNRLVVEAMRRDPVVVSPSDRVDAVALEMAERNSDAAIVVTGERVVGIFTETDIARARAKTLR